MSDFDEVLREISRRSNELYFGGPITSPEQAHGPDFGFAVGSAGERTAQAAEALATIVRAVRGGLPPREAGLEAKAVIRKIIATHNGRRKGDKDWLVGEGEYDVAIETAVARLEDAARGEAKAAA